MSTSDEYNRRKSDLRIDALEQNLNDLLCRTFTNHVKDRHIDLTPEEAEDKVREHDEMVASMERIVDLLEGTVEVDLYGRVVGRSGGMAAKQEKMSKTIDTIYERTNGGVTVTQNIKQNWTRGNKIAAVSVMSAIFFAALPGFVGFFRWLAEMWVL